MKVEVPQCIGCDSEGGPICQHLKGCPIASCDGCRQCVSFENLLEDVRDLERRLRRIEARNSLMR